jgi:hypothetical protein
MGDIAPRPELMIFALTFIGSSSSPYIQNRQLKAKLAELLYCGTLNHPRFIGGLFGETPTLTPFSVEWTFPSLISLYIGAFY